LGQLHPSHQISSGSNAPHPGSHNVGDSHSKWISDANLQPVRFSDLHQGLSGPRRAIDGGDSYMESPQTPIPTLG
jgi:hypothetical protein